MIRDLTKRAEGDNDEDDQQEEEDMNYELSMRSPLQIQHRIPSSSSPSSPSSSSESPIRRLEEVGHIDFPPFYIEGEEPYSAEELSGINQLEEVVRRATAPRDGTPAVPCPMCRSDASKGTRCTGASADGKPIVCPICIEDVSSEGCGGGVLTPCGHIFCASDFKRLGGVIEGEMDENEDEDTAINPIHELVNVLQRAIQQHTESKRVAKVACYVIQHVCEIDVTIDDVPWIEAEPAMATTLMRELFRAVENDDDDVDPSAEGDFFGEAGVKSHAFDAITSILNCSYDATDLKKEVQEWAISCLEALLKTIEEPILTECEHEDEIRRFLGVIHECIQDCDEEDEAWDALMPILRSTVMMIDESRLYAEISTLISLVCSNLGSERRSSFLNEDFQRILMPRLLATIENHDDNSYTNYIVNNVEDCEHAIDCLGDICRAFEGKAGICEVLARASQGPVRPTTTCSADAFVQALLRHLENPLLPSLLRPEIIGCIGNLAKGLTGSPERDFLGYLSCAVVQALSYASKQAVGTVAMRIDKQNDDDDDDNDDEEEQVEERRQAYRDSLTEAVAEAYSSIICGLDSSRTEDELSSIASFPMFRQGIAEFLLGLSRDSRIDVGEDEDCEDEAYLNPAVGLIGALCGCAPLFGKDAVITMLSGGDVSGHRRVAKMLLWQAEQFLGNFRFAGMYEITHINEIRAQMAQLSAESVSSAGRCPTELSPLPILKAKSGWKEYSSTEGSNDENFRGGYLRVVYLDGAIVRDGVEIDCSNKVGRLDRGTVVYASERRVDSSCGIVRFLIDLPCWQGGGTAQGWVSERIRGGDESLIMEREVSFAEKTKADTAPTVLPSGRPLAVEPNVPCSWADVARGAASGSGAAPRWKCDRPIQWPYSRATSDCTNSNTHQQRRGGRGSERPPKSGGRCGF